MVADMDVGCMVRMALLHPGGCTELGLFGWATLLFPPFRGELSLRTLQSRDCRTAHPCPCEPVCACTGMRGHARNGTSGPTMQRGAKEPLHVLSAHPRSAASRAGMAGWAGESGGRFGERRSMRPHPPQHATSARHGSATTHAGQETTRTTTTSTEARTPPPKQAETATPTHRSGAGDQPSSGSTWAAGHITALPGPATCTLHSTASSASPLASATSASACAG